MKRLLRRLFPNYVTRADLTIVESDIGGDIKLLQGRIALLESCISLSADAVEIATARLYAAEKRVEELEVGGKGSAAAVSYLKTRIDTASLSTPTSSVKAFEALPLTQTGRATRTEIVELKPKGRGPKGAGK